METSASPMKKGATVAVLFGFVAMLAACAPQATSDSSPTEAGAATMTVEWSPEADCTTCHTTEATSREDAACIASLHAASKCIDCHNETDALASEHEGVSVEDRVPKRLSKTSVSQDYCLTCHDSYKALAEKTAGFQGLVDSEGTIVNPHDLPASSDHESITCIDCHSMHAADADSAKNAKTTCVGCHHADVFACGTCH